MDLIKPVTWLRDEVITLTFKFIKKITNLVQLHVYIFYTITNLVPVNCEFVTCQPDFTVGARGSSILQALVPPTLDNYGFIFLGMMLINFLSTLFVSGFLLFVIWCSQRYKNI